MSAQVLSRSAQKLRPSVFSELTPRIKELGERCIPLHIGDTYRLPPQAALSALQRVASEELGTTRYFRYTHPFGRAELLEEVSKKLVRDNGIAVPPSGIQITCGATQALCALAQSYLDPGDEVIVLCPHWPLIRGIVETVGGKVVDAPYKETIEDPGAVLKPLLTERTKVVYFANPNNPDGRLLNGTEAERLYRFCAEHDLHIWSDEAYEHIVFDGREKVSIGSLDSGADSPRVASVFTFSKSFGMAGMRVGYVAAHPSLMESIRKVSTHQIYDLSDLTQELALAALKQTPDQYQAFLSEQTREYEKARDLLHTAFPDSEKSPGGAYLFVEFENREQAWNTMLAWLEKGVSSAPGEAFGGLHPNYLRLCFTAVPFSRLKEAVEIIRSVPRA